MRDLKFEQLRKMQREGREYICDCTSHEEFRRGVAQGKWGVGYHHAWALDAVYGPPSKQQEATQ